MAIRDYFTFKYKQTGRGISLTPQEQTVLAKTRQSIQKAIENSSQTEKNKNVGITELDERALSADFSSNINVFSKYIYARDASKKEKLKVYREMAKYPEISFAIEEIVDEAINFDKNGECITLKIKNKKIEETEIYRQTLLAEWDFLNKEIIGRDENIDRWFRDFIIDGEIAFEKIFDNNLPQEGLKRVKKLLTSSFRPIYEDIESELIIFYAYSKPGSATILNIPKEAISYANSGLFEYSDDEEEIEVVSILENAKVTYRRLKLMEDSLVIYRLVRAPERRIFHIDVGNLPKGRAEQYLKDVINRHRQKKYFDPTTGDISEGLDPIAMTEDYYFPVFQGGKQSKVETLAGGQHLDEIQDVDFFMKKLYKALRIPLTRFGEEKKFQIGDNGEITREEDKFNRFVKRLTRRYSNIFKDIFITHLKLKGIWGEIGLSEHDIDVEMISNNLFARYQEAKLLSIKFENFNNFKDLIDTETPLFSREWIVKNILEFNEEDWVNNNKLLHIENEIKKANEASMEDEGDGEL